MSARCSADRLKKIVAECVAKLGKRTGSTTEHGSKLGMLITLRLRGAGLPLPSLLYLHVGRSFRTFPQFPAHLADEEIESFARRRSVLASYLRDLEPMFWRKPRRGKPYKRKLGRLIPDLIIELPDGRLMIWDITSRTREEHIAKTQLYAEVASYGRGGRDVSVWEFHWDPPDPPLPIEPRSMIDYSRADRFL